MWDFSDTAMTFDNAGYLFDGTAPSPPPPTPVVGIGLGKSGGNVILDAKKTDETINFSFDFSSSLASGETISSCTVTASVYTGTDPAPNFIVAPSPTISGGVVYQPVQGGNEGTIYVISVTAMTSKSQILELDAFLTII